MRIAFALLCLSTILIACSRFRANQPVHAVAPAGVLVPSGMRPGADYRGLYLGSSDDTGCCWTAPVATLTVRKYAASRRVVFVIYVPDSSDPLKAWFSAHPLGITATIDGLTQHACCFKGGRSAVVFTLPPSLWGRVGSVDVRVRCAPPFRPSLADHTSTDTRSFGMFLLRAFFY